MTGRLGRFIPAAIVCGSLASDAAPAFAQVIIDRPAPAATEGCRTPANKIVAENCRPGSPREQWDIYNFGDPTIQGFATEASVNLGERIDFKIKTHSPRYRIDIYRTGWYSGSGARLMQTIRPSVPIPQAQPECRVHNQTRLVDCGTWKVSASWTVPAEAVSGVYVARLVREDDEPTSWRSEETDQAPIEKPEALPHAYGALGLGTLRDQLKEKRASHIVFIVRDDASRSAILLQTSDSTWAAFNRYGGSSLYGSWPETIGTGGNQGLTPDLSSRAFMVSLNRPNVNRAGFTQDQFFNSEYPLVRWLERNGYDVSYFSSLDTDRRGASLRNHKVFMTAGHDAFWTPGQRQHIEAARDAGVHMAFLSGTTGMWRARWEPSNDGTKTPARTLVSYKETHAEGKLDSIKEDWTGAWRDSRPFNPIGPKPENAIVGTLHVVGGLRNDPLIVPAEFASRRFWRNTSVAALKGGEKALLGKGILGSEWDQDVDNGVRPAGLIHLSATKIQNVPYLQDLGTLYDSGTATHAMTMYRAGSGALVFSAGTPQYSWGLDGLHNHWTTGGTRVRPWPAGEVPALQQATVNLLADMDVQPTSLQPGLVPAQASQDRTGPIARVEVPASGTPATGPLMIRGTAHDAEGVVAAVEVSTDDGQTWHRAEGTASWSYLWTAGQSPAPLTIKVRAVDDSGNLRESDDLVRLHGAVSQTF
jgi:Bacterial Ig domain